MQQAFYNTIAAKTTPPPAARPGLARHFAQRWDLYGVLVLMASSAAYGLLALSHLA